MQKLDNANKLRKIQTPEEELIWKKIRNSKLGFKFRRQVTIDGYIVDFCCFEKRLVIEIDGSHHRFNQQDIERDQYLKRNNFTVLRFWNSAIRNSLDKLIYLILEELNTPSSGADAPPSPVKGEG